GFRTRSSAAATAGTWRCAPPTRPTNCDWSGWRTRPAVTRCPARIARRILRRPRRPPETDPAVTPQRDALPPPAGAPTTTGDEPVFIEYRPNRRRFLAVGAVLGVVLLLGTAVHIVRSTVYSPSAVVEAYFQALADRDLAAALATTSPEATGGPDDLLDPRVLAAEV